MNKDGVPTSETGRYETQFPALRAPFDTYLPSFVNLSTLHLLFFFLFSKRSLSMGCILLLQTQSPICKRASNLYWVANNDAFGRFDAFVQNWPYLLKLKFKENNSLSTLS